MKCIEKKLLAICASLLHSSDVTVCLFGAAFAPNLNAECRILPPRNVLDANAIFATRATERLDYHLAIGGHFELLPVLRTPSLGVLVRPESDDGTAQGLYA